MTRNTFKTLAKIISNDMGNDWDHEETYKNVIGKRATEKLLIGGFIKKGTDELGDVYYRITPETMTEVRRVQGTDKFVLDPSEY